LLSFVGCTTTSYRLRIDMQEGHVSECELTNHMEHEKRRLLDRWGCSKMINPLDKTDYVQDTVICKNRDGIFTGGVAFFEKEDDCLDQLHKFAVGFAQGLRVNGDIKEVSKKKFGVKYDD